MIPAAMKSSVFRASLLGLVALLLRLYRLGEQSLWYDETYTVYVAGLPLQESWQFLVVDGVHPPLYYWLQKLSLALGESEALVRLPAAIFGALTVPGIYLLARRWIGERAALLSAMLLTLAPFHLWYSQEARMYSALAFTTVLCLGLYEASRTSERFRYRLGFILAHALAYLIHYFALFIPLIEFVQLVIHLRRQPRYLREWAGMQAIAAVPILLWIYVLSQREMASFGIGWIPSPTWRDLYLTLISFTVGYTTPLGWQHWLALILAVFLVGLGLRKPWLEPQAKSLASLWALLPMLVVFLISTRRPTYVDRFLILSQPAWLMLIASGAISLRQKASMAVSLALVMLFLFGGYNFTFSLQRPMKEEWRQAVQYLDEAMQPGEGLILRVLQIAIPYKTYSGEHAFQAMDVNGEITPLDELATGLPGVWLVYWNASNDTHRVGQDSSFDPHRESDSLAQQWISGEGPPLIGRADYNGVTILHFLTRTE